MTIKNTRYEPGMKQHPESEEKTFLTISTIKRASMVLFVVLFMVFLFLSGAIYAKSVPEPKPKFLIIHLDALSSPNFFQYMEEGYLPNLKAIFQDGTGHIIPYGLSLFPGGTETTIPHLREGMDNTTGGVGWGYYDREKDRVRSEIVTFSDLFSHIPRRAKASFFYGIPYLDSFNVYPLMNIPELLENYDVIQYFWFATDALGHYFGEEAYIASYRRFDKYIGKLLKNIDLDKINLIIYSDHGMSFGRFINAPQEEEIKRIIGESLKIHIHPNVYLKNPEEKEFWAQKIVQETEIDFAFFQEKENRVIGYSAFGKIVLEGNKNNQIRYLYEGKDFFSYYAQGYQGEWLNASEWLSFTKRSDYPGVPPNIYNLLMNEKAGDIVIVINPPKIPIFNLRYPANHAGLTKTDLLVPILLRGRELEHLYGVEAIWLHELFNEIPALDLAGADPAREKHSLSFWGNLKEEQLPGFELSLSPAYRWNVVFHYEPDLYKGWAEYDIYSSYVVRLWAGAGLQYQYPESDWGSFLNARLQMDFGKIRFNYGGQVNLNNWREWQENRKEISYRINNRLSFNWQIPNRLGFMLRW
ncbi:MAG TPA: alkaline phosphatase family protein [Atribacterota bacterium]|nr:alkaline phosphatase family protein [Atribacterota bacterium]